MASELIRLVFSLPSMKVLPFEHPDLVLYDKAYREGQENAHCGSLFPDCQLSLIDLIFGEYSTPFT